MESTSDRQSTEAKQPRLPPELLHHVVESVLPSNTRALIPTTHPSTKTLLALTRVSRVTYLAASKLLRQRCLYIDSSRRLSDMLLCMDRFVPRLPPTLSLRCITSLYLAPFPAASLDDQPTAIWVRELFCEVCETLRRLVVDMPFETLDPLDDHLNDEYFHKLPRDDARLEREIKIVLMDTAEDLPTLTCARWEEIDPRGRMTVEQIHVPTSFYGDETASALVTAWVRRGALEGTIWDWSGERIGKAPARSA
ncbi:unnamed protein product [Clonostachys rosea f. rosea IK726]|uniref:Uncharacterized protein n=2 Tax=Bionectria ochroleuca TaxID=29856 RepID=A0A0B7JPP6_BIOOC|nr:unnamed protein product [Clonostachys rosea f. rosea IK726]